MASPKQLNTAEKGATISLPTPASTTPARGRSGIKSLKTYLTCILVLGGYLAFKTVSTGENVRHCAGHRGHGVFRQPWAGSLLMSYAADKEPLTGEKAEKLFLTVPNAKDALAASRAYATHPHMAGTSEDFGDAKTILALYQTHFNITPPDSEPVFSAGTPDSREATLNITSLTSPTAWIDVYYPVMNTGLDRNLAILGEDGSALWSANLEEDGDPLDPEAGRHRDAVPAWHGLSADGEVYGQLVYANYGTKDDYDSLVEKGVDFSGKVVLTRYGGVFRGLKIKAAEDLGAVGVIIYSDPRDDGPVTVDNGYDAYPQGPARNPTSVQRGSVQYLSFYPGDPTTPGEPAYQNATRTEGGNIPKIPSLPISWENAQVLLAELGGNEDGRKADGTVSERLVKLVNHVDTKVTPIWNSMAAIPGHIKDEVVLIGGHRDAWVMGAADPTSGQVSIHEVVRGYGALLEKGWKPLRTIVFASWDAEEYGLIGSTEWGEDFPEWISDHVVSYLNLDVSVSGSRFNLGASPSLAHLLRAVAEELPHPTDPSRTLWSARTDSGPFTGPADADFTAAYETAEEKRKAGAANTGVGALGSGSDYTVFLQRLGVASSDAGFGNTPQDAPYHYHSIYDTQRWQEVYADPTFERHTTIAKHLGLTGLRLIDAIILPLNTTQYALELGDYLSTVKTAAEDYDVTPDLSALESAISAVQNSSAALDVEKEEAEADFVRLLKKLQGQELYMKEVHAQMHERYRHGPDRAHARAHALTKKKWKNSLHRIVRRIKKALGLPTTHRKHHGEDHDNNNHNDKHHDEDKDKKETLKQFIAAAKRVQRANKKLVSFERGFISEGGIKDREWYRNLVVAPGKWLGYGATTLPALTEAIVYEQNKTYAQQEADRLTDLFEVLAKQLRP